MKETINNEEGMALLLDCLSSLSKTDRVELIEFLLGKKIPKTFVGEPLFTKIGEE